MKFIYIDESGSRDEGDVFVTCGLMVDAYKLRKKTADFDARLEALFARHPGARTELKTKRFINGSGGWRNIDAQERKDFLTDVCRLAVSNGGRVYGIAISYAAFDTAIEADHGHPFGASYWLTGALFTGCLVQKKMQTIRNSKGLTVVIMDDNKAEMPEFSGALYEADPWLDGLYQLQKRRRGVLTWQPRTTNDRFDHIINTAFAIKSNHSSLIQVADAICYIYRRHLELMTDEEVWVGEQAYYQSLFNILEPQREKLGRCPNASCRTFYCDAKHPEWEL